MRILYSEGAFMPKSSAMETSESGYRFLLCYSALVRWSMEQKKLQKLNHGFDVMLHHIMADLRSAAENPSVTLVYNPVGNCTSQCEDFIGHIARLYTAALADKLGLLSFVWPERDLNDLKAHPWKAPLSMQMGDLLAFHSFEVAHGAGRLMDVDSDAVRLSLDARCHCAEFSNRPVRTRRGEICAPVWFYGGQAQHGCQRSLGCLRSTEPWCVIYRQADEAGAGCILKNDTLCTYPCDAEEECSLQSFDYCG
eukprot:s8131_g1.t1